MCIDDLLCTRRYDQPTRLIEDYIAEARVVVPLPNRTFDPARFDPSRIGVQPGGLKMPPVFQRDPKRQVAANSGENANKKSLLGWLARSAEASVEGESLRIGPTGRQPFITHANMRAGGPVEFRLRVKTAKNGTARLQWRTADQQKFPQTGQSKSFDIVGGEWQELTIPLDIEGSVVHIRLFLSSSKQLTEIDWIEIGSSAKDRTDGKRWDFKAAAKPAAD